MNILAIDTTFDKSYVTLLQNDKIVSSYTIESQEDKYHSAFLMSNIAKILRENSIQMSDLNAITTNVGPGSFTGIRVGLTCAKVISHQLSISAIGITSCEIIAQLNKTTSKTIVLNDARRSKFYAAIYEGDKEILPVCTVEKTEMLNYASNPHYIVLSDNSVSAILKEEKIKHTCWEEMEHPFGDILVRLAANKLKSGNKDFSWFNLKPLYIQPPPISCKK